MEKITVLGFLLFVEYLRGTRLACPHCGLTKDPNDWVCPECFRRHGTRLVESVKKAALKTAEKKYQQTPLEEFPELAAIAREIFGQKLEIEQDEFIAVIMAAMSTDPKEIRFVAQRIAATLIRERKYALQQAQFEAQRKERQERLVGECAEAVRKHLPALPKARSSSAEITREIIERPEYRHLPEKLIASLVTYRVWKLGEKKRKQMGPRSQVNAARYAAAC